MRADHIGPRSINMWIRDARGIRQIPDRIINRTEQHLKAFKSLGALAGHVMRMRVAFKNRFIFGCDLFHLPIDEQCIPFGDDWEWVFD